METGWAALTPVPPTLQTVRHTTSTLISDVARHPFQVGQQTSSCCLHANHFPLLDLMSRGGDDEPAPASAASAAAAASADMLSPTPLPLAGSVIAVLGLDPNSVAAAAADPATMKLGPDFAGFYTKRGDYEVVRTGGRGRCPFG